jgi:hypothetical protein
VVILVVVLFSDIMWSPEARKRWAEEKERQNAATDGIDATPRGGEDYPDTPKRRTLQAWNTFNKHFFQNNLKDGPNDIMFKNFSYSDWDQYIWRMDDRGIQGWPKVRWYEWLLAARSREKKEAEEMKEAEKKEAEEIKEAQRLQEEAERLQEAQRLQEMKEAEKKEAEEIKEMTRKFLIRSSL